MRELTLTETEIVFGADTYDAYAGCPSCLGYDSYAGYGCDPAACVPSSDSETGWWSNLYQYYGETDPAIAAVIAEFDPAERAQIDEDIARFLRTVTAVIQNPSEVLEYLKNYFEQVFRSPKLSGPGATTGVRG